jgi:hypothetical protein
MVSLLSMTLPPKSLCSLFPRAAAGGAWPPASTRGVLLHPSGGHHRLPPWDVRGGDAPSCFFLHHSRGRMITSLVKCPPTPWGGKRAVLRLHLFGFDGFGVASNAASRRQAGHGCPSSSKVAKQVRCVRGVSCATGRTALTPLGGSYKTSYAVEVAAAFLDGLVLTPVGGWGRGPLRTR